jgi:hypothetical protein
VQSRTQLTMADLRITEVRDDGSRLGLGRDALSLEDNRAIIRDATVSHEADRGTVVVPSGATIEWTRRQRTYRVRFAKGNPRTTHEIMVRTGSDIEAGDYAARTYGACEILDVSEVC